MFSERERAPIERTEKKNYKFMKIDRCVYATD